jgi:hypothetical protein
MVSFPLGFLCLPRDYRRLTLRTANLESAGAVSVFDHGVIRTQQLGGDSPCCQRASRVIGSVLRRGWEVHAAQQGLKARLRV